MLNDFDPIIVQSRPIPMGGEQWARTEAEGFSARYSVDDIATSRVRDAAPARGGEISLPSRLFAPRATKPQPFQPRSYLRCLALGHDMVLSRSHPARITCRRCRLRRAY